MKPLLLTMMVFTSWIVQAQELDRPFTFIPYLGLKSVAWTTKMPVPPSPFGSSPITQEAGILPMAGLTLQYQLPQNYLLRLKAEGYTGNTKLNGEYGRMAGYGPGENAIATVRNQRVKWDGVSFTLEAGRTFDLNEAWRLQPAVSIAYSQWRIRPPVVDNPQVVVYQSSFDWYRAGVGVELSWQLNATSRLYIHPSLRIPVSTKQRLSNFRTVDNFQAIQEDLVERELSGVGVQELIDRAWGDRSARSLKAKMGFAAELGWQSKRMKVSLYTENLVIERLTWAPYPQAKGLFTSLRLGVPIQLGNRKQTYEGHFMRSNPTKK